MAWIDFKRIDFKQSPEKEFWFWAVITVVGLLALLATLTVLYWLEQRGAVGALPGSLQSKLLFFVFVLAVPPVVIVVVLLRIFFSNYVLPVSRLEEDLEALLHGSRGTRLRLEEGTRLGRLEARLNELLERHNVTEEQIESRLNEALKAQGREKQELESVMEALSEGVVVCNLAGKVLSYNSAGKRLMGGGNQLGVGRSIHNIVEKPLFDYALEAAGTQIMDDGGPPSARFILNRQGKEDLLLRVTLLQGLDKKPGGYILTCEDPAAMATAPVHMGQQPPLPPDTARGHAGNGEKQRPDAASMALDDLRYVVFDTETTGLSPSEGDEIISIGAVSIANGRIVYKETFEQLVDPERDLKPSSIKVHGIVPEMLVGMPKICAVLPEFAGFAHDAVLVAHNAAFDMRFLKDKEQQAGIHFDQPVLDTLLLSSVLHPTQPSHSLDTLLSRYGIEESGRHTALGDALMTAELFLKLLPQLKARGVTTLAMALDASRKSPLAKITF